MKKNILAIIIGLLGVAVAAAPALAATTFSFAPTNVSVTQGQDFNLAVTINPQGVKNYTAKLELDYPADLLEIKSFTFGGSWMAISQQGYDLVDNTNGNLIKTAGYPGGITSSALLGTAVFSAKKAGNGVIAMGSESLALDAENKNLLSGAPQASVTIKEIPKPTPPPTPTVSSTPPPAPSGSVTSPKEDVSPATSSEEELEDEGQEAGEGEDASSAVFSEPAETPTQEEFSLFAGIGNIITFGTGSPFIGVIVALIILAIIYIIIRGIRKRKSE